MAQLPRPFRRERPQPRLRPIKPRLIDEARKELEHGDYIATRCVKAEKPYPREWRERDDVLRGFVRRDLAVAEQEKYKLPERPARPAGI